MAELGDFLLRGSQGMKEPTLEMLDYRFVDECTDMTLLRGILSTLQSGKEGVFPDLVKHTEDRLLSLLPSSERVKIARMKSEPGANDIYEVKTELLAWEKSLSLTDLDGEKDKLKEERAPRWSSGDRVPGGCGEKGNSVSHLPPVRGRSTETREQDNTRLTAEPLNIEGSKEEARSKRLSGYNFRAWEAYDAEAEIRILDSEAGDKKHQKMEGTAGNAVNHQQQLGEARVQRIELMGPSERKQAANIERCKGKEALQAAELDAALKHYTFAIELDGSDPVHFKNRALVAQKLELYEQAEQDCTRALDLDSSDPKTWFRRGTARHSRGKYLEAMYDYEEAMKRNPQDPKIVDKLRAKSMKKYKEVEGECAVPNRCTKTSVRILVEEVMPDQVTVEEEASSVLLSVPMNHGPPPHLGRAPVKVVLERCEEQVLSEWKQSSKEPQLQHTSNTSNKKEGHRIEILFDEEDDEELSSQTCSSETEYCSIRHLDGSGMETENEARRLYEKEDFVGARSKYLQAIKEEHENPKSDTAEHYSALVKLNNNLSACLLRLGQYEDAVKAANNVLKIDPNNEKARFRREGVLDIMGREAGTMTMERKTQNKAEAFDVNIGGENSSPGLVTVEAEKQSNDLKQEGNDKMEGQDQEGAIELYRQALKLNPGNLKAANNCAQAYIDLKRYDEAEQLASMVLHEEPGNIKAKFRRGLALWNKDPPDLVGAKEEMIELASMTADKKVVDALSEIKREEKRAVTEKDGTGPQSINASLVETEETQRLEQLTGRVLGGNVDAVLKVQPEENTDEMEWCVTDNTSSNRSGATKIPIVEEDSENHVTYTWSAIETCVSKEEERHRMTALEGHKQKGRQHAQSGQQKQALSAFTQGIVAAPEDVDCFTARSELYLSMDVPQLAFEDASAAVNLAPGLILPLVLRGRASLSMYENERKIEHFHHAWRDKQMAEVLIQDMSTIDGPTVETCQEHIEHFKKEMMRAEGQIEDQEKVLLGGL